MLTSIADTQKTNEKKTTQDFKKLNSCIPTRARAKQYPVTSDSSIGTATSIKQKNTQKSVEISPQARPQRLTRLLREKNGLVLNGVIVLADGTSPKDGAKLEESSLLVDTADG